MTSTTPIFDPTTCDMLQDVHANPGNPASLYIDGQWVPAADGETRTITCPADRSEVGVVSEASEQDTERAIAAARRAFDSGEWSSVPASERGMMLIKVAQIIRERKDVFAHAEAADTGKRLAEAYIDMDDIANAFDYFGTLAQHQAGRVVDPGDPNVRSRIDAEPVGVCGLITPWNYPLLQVAWKVAPALAAGNAFVLKQAELTPHTAMLLMAVLEEVGVPAGVANLITGAGARCGNPLSTHPDVDMVSFTGGLATGKIIARNAAETVKRVALELGGKNPNVIFADADFDAAVDNALNGAFVHSGQVCSAGSRIVVEESIHDKFVEALVDRAKTIKIGGPLDEAAETGALISAEHLDKVAAYVDEARSQGATIACGGRRATEEDNDGSHSTGHTDLTGGEFYLPTVIDHCTAEMDCVHAEAFGPTVTIETFRTEDEAVAIANDTEYGLAGAVWSSSQATAERVARRLRHGTIWINDFHPYLPQAEWGGMKQSGNGRELGPTGLAEYQEHKHVYTNIAPAVTGWFAQK
ncbi:aldehyde dehydrogenase family protein [Corynebacterium zhongnanshanii]|uniref:Aldehyde dehydrogenase family protein n=2 Tax=Corynebacterium zhongnanshanii TaxID=2768834 RepID=A0ABQ6VFX8_9CORY|nr:aldehyde dehydrogenase family protein [Corynebacterium zhongnanshanii]KAB3523322.1 aldehyde dehydrogenase family protein [Corynebacterium zhongnanshanii]